VATFFRARHGADAEVAKVEELVTALNTDKALQDKFTLREARTILKDMHDTGKLMFADDTIHLL
jgi:hypothetical protein